MFNFACENSKLHMNSNDSTLSDSTDHPYKGQNIGQYFSKQAANYYQNANSRLLLFSCDTVLGEMVRNALNEFTCDYFDANYLSDGGDLMDESDLLKIYDLAMHQNKTIVLIGASPDFMSKLQKLWDEQFQPVSISYITDQSSPLQYLDIESIYLKEINVIGFQRQHSLVSEKFINYFRLGEYRNNPATIEPAIRRSDLIYFNLNAIRSSDSPGSLVKNPSGFYAEEASSISRMAGMSDRLKLFAVSDWNENKDLDKITANLVAQMVWYFWEGCHLKQLDQNLDKNSLTQYLVEIKDLDYIITFYKSEHSGKWWFEEPLIDNEFSNQLIPCSYEEYLATAKDQIPNRILEMING